MSTHKRKQTTESTLKPTKKMKTKMTEEEYDQFLVEKKDGRLKRIGKWSGMTKRVEHQCSDSACARKWSPTPEQCLNDDYYCPSCVLHHRNNVDRFNTERLKWTADVPNTFYVFSMVDPALKNGNYDNDNRLIKFGRTQHEDPLKRYPTAELKTYQMKLILQLRGRLITMTEIENWWKDEAQKKNYFVRFSNVNFHGQTECVRVSRETLDVLIDKSQQMAQNDRNSEN